MGYLLFSVNHTTANVALRTAVVLQDSHITSLYKKLKLSCPAAELVVLSTCNRTELYLWSDDAHAHSCTELVFTALECVSQLPIEHIKQHCACYTGSEVTTHLVKVAAGFLSMIVGETQIFGQIKKAYKKALTSTMTSTHLNTLFQKAFHLAKEIRTKSGIGQDTVSLASAVAKLCTHIYSPYVKHTIVFIGAGDTIRITMQHLATVFRYSTRIICNRTLSNAQTLATQPNDTVQPLTQIFDCVQQADIIICATNHNGVLVNEQMVQSAMHKKHLQLYIDLSVPINIAKEVSDIENVYHYNVDALSPILNDNLHTRRTTAQEFGSYLMDKSLAIYAELPSHPTQQLLRTCYTECARLLDNEKGKKALLHRIAMLLRATQDTKTKEHIARFLLKNSSIY